MSDPEMHKLETVAADSYGRAMVDRLRVPGGWIYSTYREPGANDYINSCFVPEVPVGANAQHHVCDHGFAATSCGPCSAKWREWNR